MKHEQFQDRVPPPELKEQMRHGNLASFTVMSLAQAAQIMSQRYDRKFCAEDIRQIEASAMKKCRKQFVKLGFEI